MEATRLLLHTANRDRESTRTQPCWSLLPALTNVVGIEVTACSTVGLPLQCDEVPMQCRISGKATPYWVLPTSASASYLRLGVVPVSSQPPKTVSRLRMSVLTAAGEPHPEMDADWWVEVVCYTRSPQ